MQEERSFKDKVQGDNFFSCLDCEVLSKTNNFWLVTDLISKESFEIDVSTWTTVRFYLKLGELRENVS